MLVLNFLFFLPNSMILSIFMLGIKIRAILNLELKGLHENVQSFYSRYLGSREMAKNEVETVLVDTLYKHYFRSLIKTKLQDFCIFCWMFCFKLMWWCVFSSDDNNTSDFSTLIWIVAISSFQLFWYDYN